MEEQITLDGQKYTIIRRHTWGRHSRLDQDLIAHNVKDQLFIRKPRGQRIFHVTLYNSGHSSPIRKTGIR